MIMQINEVNKDTINTRYAQKFPLKNLVIIKHLVIKNNRPYIVLDRDEVYDISNIINLIGKEKSND